LLAEFFRPEYIDYHQYLYSLALFIFGAAAFSVASATGRYFPWIWLTAFGTVRGLAEWLGLLAIALEKGIVVGNAFAIIRAASYALLACFWVSTLINRKHRFGAYFAAFLLFAGIIAAWLLWPDKADLLARYVLAIPGGTLAAIALFGHAKSAAAGRRTLLSAAICLIGYTFLFWFATITDSGPVLLAIKTLLCLSLAALLMSFSRVLRQAAALEWRLDANCVSCRWAMGAVVALAVAAYFVSGAAGKEEDAQLREELLNSAKSVAGLLEPERIDTLKGDETDYSNPDWQALRGDMMKIKAGNSKIRFAYLMALENGKAIFLVDSEPADSQDYSPPGQVYFEAEADLYRVFDTGIPAVSGPYRDRWGDWVTAFVPIGGGNGKPPAVMGLDMASERFLQSIASRRALAITMMGILTGLFISFTIVMILSRDRELQIAISEAKHRIVSDFTYNWEYWMSPEGGFVYVSPAAERIAGVPASEIASGAARFEELFRASERDAIKKQLEECKRSGEAVSANYQMETGGQVKFVSHICTPILSEDGRFRGIRGSIVDITARRLAEAEKDRLIAELEKSLSEIKTLKGLVPICAWCKKIRNDEGYWQQMEAFISEHSEAEFSHGICPDCAKKVLEES